MNSFEETKELLKYSNFYYVICTNMEGNYSYVNQHYADVFSKIHGDMVGKPYDITMHPEDTKTCAEVAAKCFAYPDRVFPATIRKHDGKGGFVITQWDYKAIMDDNNSPSGMFCLGYDVTDYKIKTEELELANGEITKKNGILKQIAFNQSHVIRRPLANILGIVSILEKMDTDQNMKNLLAMLFESSRELDNVIKDIVTKTYE